MKRRSPWSFSKFIACGVLTVDASSTYAVLYFCRLAILRGYTGTLPYLTTLIGALQAASAVVLCAYFGKSKAENTRGGITYDAAMNPERDC
jgi:hypothetical protein